MDMSTSFDTHIAVSNLLDFSEDGLWKRSILFGQIEGTTPLNHSTTKSNDFFKKIEKAQNCNKKKVKDFDKWEFCGGIYQLGLGNKQGAGLEKNEKRERGFLETEVWRVGLLNQRIRNLWRFHQDVSIFGRVWRSKVEVYPWIYETEEEKRERKEVRTENNV